MILSHVGERQDIVDGHRIVPDGAEQVLKIPDHVRILVPPICESPQYMHTCPNVGQHGLVVENGESGLQIQEVPRRVGPRHAGLGEHVPIFSECGTHDGLAALRAVRSVVSQTVAVVAFNAIVGVPVRVGHGAVLGKGTSSCGACIDSNAGALGPLVLAHLVLTMVLRVFRGAIVRQEDKRCWGVLRVVVSPHRILSLYRCAINVPYRVRSAPVMSAMAIVLLCAMARRCSSVRTSPSSSNPGTSL